jgi:histidinol dehydrogenase
MKILRYTQSGFGTRLAKLNRRAAPSEAVAATVAEILANVRQKGDAALCQYTLKFDKARLRPADLPVEDEELTVAANDVGGAAREAFAIALANITEFAKHGLRKDWQFTTPQGIVVGERYQPIRRVGVYVPGGTAPLVSTSFMTVALASAAGVPEIVVTTPPGPDGGVNPLLLHALEMAGATEIYKVGGAQAIGALAYGTKTIAPVSKIFGPGNAYVTEAKRQVFGQVAIDLLAGPSEVMVLADESAHAPFVAADLLAQAEHDMESMAVLVTNSSDILEKTRQEIEKQAAKLSRAKQIKAVLACNWPMTSRRNTWCWPPAAASASSRRSPPPAPFSPAAGPRWRAVISWPAPATCCPPAARVRASAA